MQHLASEKVHKLFQLKTLILICMYTLMITLITCRAMSNCFSIHSDDSGDIQWIYINPHCRLVISNDNCDSFTKQTDLTLN